MIDPQNQATIFLKRFGTRTREGSFQCIKASDPKMVEGVITAVKFGYWVLLENLGLTLDTTLEPIFLQQKIKKGNYIEIKIGDKVIPYNEEFKLLMITTISNPHYSPETFAKITIINFAITPFGLEDQMLSELVKIEMPELEENKNKIMEENFKNDAILKEIEDKILYNLSKNRENIEETLTNNDLIDILSEAKIKAKEIGEKMIESEKTGKEIDTKRELYRGSAIRASTLFFSLIDISTIDPMYQYSLIHFKTLFGNTVKYLPQSPSQQQRLTDINLRFSKDFYDFTCRSLFEKDKLLFSFVMAYKILMTEFDNKISPSELRFLLAGPSSDIDITFQKNPTDWISEIDWNGFYAQIYGMGLISDPLKGFCEYFMKNHHEFLDFYKSLKNENYPLPQPWNTSLTDFQKLLVIKALRLDKLNNAITYFIEQNLGKEFVEPPTFDVAKSYKESTYLTPLLFVLTTGSDPVNDFRNLAESQGRKCELVSLGKGMEKIAISKIEDTKIKGSWILLQNCHLSISFMPKLEDMIDGLLSATNVEPTFRLWLTR